MCGKDNLPTRMPSWSINRSMIDEEVSINWFLKNRNDEII